MSGSIERATAYLEAVDKDVLPQLDVIDEHAGMQLTRSDLEELIADAHTARQKVPDLVDQLIDGVQAALTNATDATFAKLLGPGGHVALTREQVDKLHEQVIDAFRLAAQVAGDGML